MENFFQDHFDKIIDSPNQSEIWWHSIPLPNGNRINGCQPDKNLQLKMWRALQIEDKNGLTDKYVLDIGANDGFFTLAAIMAGAKEVTAIDKDWVAWPKNIEYVSQLWEVKPKIVTADFRIYDFHQCYDVIFFFGVLYHLEDVFSCMKTLNQLLEPDGIIYLETQISKIKSDLPIFEYASDIYPTTAKQYKQALTGVGISNYLFPNDYAIHNLAYSYNFQCESLSGPHNLYTQENPMRQMYKLTKVNFSDLTPNEIMLKLGFSIDEHNLRRYDASLSDGIDFRRIGLPIFIKNIKGLSNEESWGRWSDANEAPSVQFTFFESLPEHFSLLLEAIAFGPNVGEDLILNIDSKRYKIKILKDNFRANLDIDLSKEKIDTIEFIAPKPTSPKELGESGDSRKLGIGFIKMQIVEKK